MLTEAVIQQTIRSAKDLDFLKFTEPENSSDYVRQCRVLNSWTTTKTNGVEDMIHITVPDTQTLVEKKDGISRYTAFNIHVNGWFHAAVRFSTLFQFAEGLKHKFGSHFKGPKFPPKKIFRHLDDKQMEDRRVRLTKYLQSLVQHPEISSHRYVEQTFLDWQIDSYRPTSSCVSVVVYLGDGEKVTIKCNVTNSTNEVMQLVAEKLGCNYERFAYSFGLFIGRQRSEKERESTSDSDNELIDLMSVRLLRNFESPYVSVQLMNQRSAARRLVHRIMIRKLVWDPRIEESLLDDPALARLLYAQSKGDYLNGNLPVVKREHIDSLNLSMKQGNAVQFVRTCHRLPDYGYEILAPCKGDIAERCIDCSLRVGRRQLIISYQLPGKQEEQHSIFRATRIRVWRISQPPIPSDPLIFQFEYLVAKEQFNWVTLYTDQAILLSLLLKSIGSEILNEHRNLTIEEQMKEGFSGNTEQIENWRAENTAIVNPVATSAYLPRENTLRRDSTQSNTSSAQSSALDSSASAQEDQDPLGVTQVYESFTDVFTTITDALPIQNDAFNNITDDDL